MPSSSSLSQGSCSCTKIAYSSLLYTRSCYRIVINYLRLSSISSYSLCVCVILFNTHQNHCNLAYLVFLSRLAVSLMITRSKSLLQLLQDLAIVMDPSQAAIVYGHRAVRYVRKPSATHAHAQSVREVGLAETPTGTRGIIRDRTIERRISPASRRFDTSVWSRKTQVRRDTVQRLETISKYVLFTIIMCLARNTPKCVCMQVFRVTRASLKVHYKVFVASLNFYPCFHYCTTKHLHDMTVKALTLYL